MAGYFTDMVMQQVINDKLKMSSDAAGHEMKYSLPPQVALPSKKRKDEDESSEEGGDSDREDRKAGDADFDLEAIRAQRLAKLKAEHKAAAENRAKGHGELSEIIESEFLDAVTKNDKAIVHFYHRSFRKCKVIDKHLSLLAPLLLDIKMVRLDAQKAPFFVERLRIRVLPTTVLFVKGIAVYHLVGFEGLRCIDGEDVTTLSLARVLYENDMISDGALDSLERTFGDEHNRAEQGVGEADEDDELN
ncbi:thioredoxin domain-containing protein, putative [Perkinsus marinus ATCC 50983]|uniref:Thioredoxin domain-containing protein, putative n=1 Tax=Perkinsus marinus (strain ATCC 50983 / TXsc) TaxID=423536 RepID=C5L6I8_PERM5|nr:thioredoxin domain-containing protein, putative [Perkinsus marinus ATCC 50983]EER07649.1 thioredoxin domain-containing protein, putative [Perkinsus marinus ATCC 50983]|eukprot:XP_002775833.1 thioredoxin domain-containing protein, putative [Perkinsus marinus ATCC 50983]